MEEELDLGRYLRIIRRHRLIIILGALVGGAAGVLGASLRPVLYEGVTTILIGRSDSVIATATSRALLENYTLAAETLTQVRLPIPAQSFVANSLVVEQVPGTNVVKVRVKLGDAEHAAQVSRVLSEKAVELNRRVASEEGTAVRSQLKVLLDQAAERLKNAEDQYLLYQDQAQIELLKKDTEKMIAERGELLRLRLDIATEKARLGAAEDEIKKQDRLLPAPRAIAAETALQRAAGHSAEADSTNEILRQTSDRMEALKDAAALEGKRDSTFDVKSTADMKKNTPAAKTNTYDVPNTKEPPATDFATQSVDVTQNALRQLSTPGPEVDPQTLDLSHPFINPVYQTLSFQIASSRTRLAALERQQREMLVVDKLGKERFGELSELYRRTIELARLQTSVDLARRVYTDLATRYEQSRAEAVGSMVQLQIVDPATPPDRPLSRKRAQAGVLGLTVGLVVAGIAALARGILEDRRTA
jgi:hypothetical protein